MPDISVTIGMQQAWLLPAMPVVAFLIISFFRKILPREGDFLAVIGMLGVLLVTLFIIIDFQGFFHDGEFHPGQANVYAFDWVRISADNFLFLIEFSTYIDAISVVMLIAISIVGLMVAIYSTGYMQGEDRYGWYFAVLSLFVAAMLLLVTSGSLIWMYLAWEGVGLASYLLIGHYWDRQSAAEAAKKAFITTRIGDVGLLIGIILLWKATGSFDIQTIIAAATSGQIGETYLTVAMLALFAGAVGKSAQFPLHVWLPDAMEGPTPASALIHAATMVVAGVYLIARFSPVYEVVLVARDVILYTGLLTAFLAASMGLVTSDIKRVLAFSTISQLGFMFVALGVGAVGAAMFHVLTHAFFKALLFLGSGSVIHATGRQEVEYLGGLRRKQPVTAATFIVGSLALAGIPIFAGFWSKDEILHSVSSYASPFVYIVLAGTAVLTAIYTTRLVLLTFFGSPRDKSAFDHAHESPSSMTVPLLLLGLLATVSGFFVFDAVGKLFGFSGGIGYLVYLHHPHAFHIDWAFASVATVSSLTGVIIGWVYWHGGAERAIKARAWSPDIHALLVNRYYLDELYQGIINRVVLGLAGIVAWFDKKIVNETGVDGGAQLIGYFGYRLKFLQTGKIPNYALGIATGILVLSVMVLARA